MPSREYTIYQSDTFFVVQYKHIHFSFKKCLFSRPDYYFCDKIYSIWGKDTIYLIGGCVFDNRDQLLFSLK